MTSVEFIEPMSDAEGAARAAELFKQAYGKGPQACGPHRGA